MHARTVTPVEGSLPEGDGEDRPGSDMLGKVMTSLPQPLQEEDPLNLRQFLLSEDDPLKQRLAEVSQAVQQLCDDLADPHQHPVLGQHEDDWASALSFADQPLGGLNPTSTRSHLVSPENGEEKSSGLYGQRPYEPENQNPDSFPLVPAPHRDRYEGLGRHGVSAPFAPLGPLAPSQGSSTVIGDHLDVLSDMSWRRSRETENFRGPKRETAASPVPRRVNDQRDSQRYSKSDTDAEIQLLQQERNSLRTELGAKVEQVEDLMKVMQTQLETQSKQMQQTQDKQARAAEAEAQAQQRDLEETRHRLQGMEAQRRAWDESRAAAELEAEKWRGDAMAARQELQQLRDVEAERASEVTRLAKDANEARESASRVREQLSAAEQDSYGAADIRRQLEEEKRAHQRQRDEAASLRSAMGEKQDKILEIQRDLGQVQQDWARERTAWAAERGSLRADSGLHQKELDDLGNVVADLKRGAAAAAEREALLRKALDDVRDGTRGDRERLAGELRQLQQDAEAAQAHAAEQARDREATLRRELVELRGELNEARSAERAAQETTKRAVGDQHEAASREFNDLNQKLQEARQGQLAALKRERLSQRDADEARQRARESEARVATLEGQVEELNRQTSQLVAAKEALASAAVEFKAKMTHERGRVAAMAEEHVSSALAAQAREAQQQLAAEAEAAATLELQLRGEVVTLQERESALVEAKCMLESEVSGLQSMVASLEQRIEAKNLDMDRLRTSEVDTMKEVLDLREKLRESDTARLEATAAAAAAQDQLRVWQDQASQASASADAAQSTTADAERRASTAETALAAAEGRTAQAWEQVKRERARAEEATATASAAQATEIKARGDAEDLADQVSRLQNQGQVQRERIATLEAQAEAAQLKENEARLRAVATEARLSEAYTREDAALAAEATMRRDLAEARDAEEASAQETRQIQQQLQQSRADAEAAADEFAQSLASLRAELSEAHGISQESARWASEAQAATLADLTAEVHMSEHRRLNAESKAESLRNELAEAYECASNLEGKVTMHRQLFDDLRRQNESFALEAQRLTAGRAGADQRVQDLESQVKRLTEQLQHQTGFMRGLGGGTVASQADRDHATAIANEELQLRAEHLDAECKSLVVELQEARSKAREEERLRHKLEALSQEKEEQGSALRSSFQHLKGQLVAARDAQAEQTLHAGALASEIADMRRQIYELTTTNVASAVATDAAHAAVVSTREQEPQSAAEDAPSGDPAMTDERLRLDLAAKIGECESLKHRLADLMAIKEGLEARCRDLEGLNDMAMRNLDEEKQRLENRQTQADKAMAETETLNAELRHRMISNQATQSESVLQELQNLRNLKTEFAGRESDLKTELREAKEKKKAYKALLLAYEEEIWRLRGQIDGLRQQQQQQQDQWQQQRQKEAEASPHKNGANGRAAAVVVMRRNAAGGL